MLFEVITNGDDISYLPTTLGKVLLAVLFLGLLAAAAAFAGRRNSSRKKNPSGRHNSTKMESPSLEGCASRGHNALPKKNASEGACRPASENPPGKAYTSGQKNIPGKTGVKLGAKQMAFCAVAIALGTVLSNLKLYSFLFGGSVTLLSMLFICLPGYWFGTGAGVITGVAYGILQLIIDPYVIHPVQLLADYPLAFGAFGLSGLFTERKNGLVKGYLAGITGRWIFSSISGWIFFAEYAWEGWHPLPYTLAYNGCYIFAEGAITLAVLAVPQVREAFARIKKMAVAS